VRCYSVECEKFVALVVVSADKSKVIWTAPILKIFRGQHPKNLGNWVKKTFDEVRFHSYGECGKYGEPI